MENQEKVLTKERIEELEAELEQLKTIRRKEIADKIKTARSYGDLSENSEYDEAKNEQAIIEARIITIEKTLTNIRVLDVDDISTDKVGLHSIVTFKASDSKSNETFTIVNANESDPASGKISSESPIGAALLGKAVGNSVEVMLPNGSSIKLKITAIARPDGE